jgi:hypothetical protein
VVKTYSSVWISRSGRTCEITGFDLARTTSVGLATTQPEYCRTIRYCRTISPANNFGDAFHCHLAEVVKTYWSVWISRIGRTCEITGFDLARTTSVGLATTQPEYCRTIRYCRTISPGSIVILRHYITILIQCYGRTGEFLLAKAWKTLLESQRVAHFAHKDVSLLGMDGSVPDAGEELGPHMLASPLAPMVHIHDQINGRPADVVCGTFCRSPLVAAIADSTGSPGLMDISSDLVVVESKVAVSSSSDSVGATDVFDEVVQDEDEVKMEYMEVEHPRPLSTFPKEVIPFARLLTKVGCVCLVLKRVQPLSFLK